MARAIHSRLIIEGTLVAEAPLHVGGLGESVETDLPLARNGRGEFYVPGTSLAGPMRAWCEAVFSPRYNRLLELLWGCIGGRDGGDQGHAAHIAIEDGSVHLPDGSSPELRDGVGIDRYSGAAAERVKFDRMVLPVGTEIGIRITVELPADKKTSGDRSADRDGMSTIVGHLLDALCEAQVSIGAATTRGLGRVRLEGFSIRVQDYSSRERILAVVSGGASYTTIEGLKRDTSIQPMAQPSLSVEIEWKPRTPVMVKSGVEGILVDSVPMMGHGEDGFCPLLPGSSIKGALRSHAERIVRTVLNLNVPDGKETRNAFLEQVKVPLVQNLFGAAGKRSARSGQKDDVSDKREPEPGKGALRVDDCLGKPISKTGWREFLELADGKDAAVPKRLSQLSREKWQQAFHVAVDRWTGGAAENLLFSVLELHAEEWEPIRLRLDLSRIPEDKQLAAIALLILTLEDFIDGAVPLGFAVNRGMGTVQVMGVTLTGTALPRDWKWEDFSAGRNENLISMLPRGFRSSLNEAWKNWLRAKGA